MSLSPLTVHLVCLALWLLDLGARALRTRVCLRAFGQNVSFGRTLELNAWGDAAAGVTPLRLGGEPARLAGMVGAGATASSALLTIGLEAVAQYPLVAAVGLGLAMRTMPEWWRHAGQLMVPGLPRLLPWVAGVAVVTLVGAMVVWRWRGVEGAPATALPEVPRIRWTRRLLPAMLVAVPASLVNLGSRVLVLPLLALTLPAHPPVEVMLLGSFVLLYSQLLLPVPSGAGVVDLGFLAGAAGDLGGGLPTLLAWRFYTSGAGIALGLGLGLRRLGARELRLTISRYLRPLGLR